jgi:hypothetical protein
VQSICFERHAGGAHIHERFAFIYRRSQNSDRSRFLLLDNDHKNAFLTAFGLDQNKPDFNAVTLPQMWSMDIFILKNLSTEELSRRMWIIREKFRLQAGDAVYANYVAQLPEKISGTALQQGVAPESHPLLKEDAVSISRQMQRMNYYRMQRDIAINKKKEVPIFIFLC